MLPAFRARAKLHGLAVSAAPAVPGSKAKGSQRRGGARALLALGCNAIEVLDGLAYAPQA